MIPVITIGGFLGCGKTTLINYLLANPQGRKLAVIVNDIGSINIDEQLIKNADDNKIALTNGCICCSLKSDLFDAVKRLCEEASDCDAIVIEASGVSDPAALVASLKLLESAGIARAETVVYLVDAESYSELDFDSAENVLDNAAACDLLAINKTDIATTMQIRELRQSLRDVAEGVETLETQFSRIPVDLLFAPRKTNICRTKLPAESEIPHHGYREITIRFEAPVNRELFKQFVNSISTFAWRAKGFLIFDDLPEEIVLFNLVGKRASLEIFSSATDIEAPGLGVVVIGRSELMPESLVFS